MLKGSYFLCYSYTYILISASTFFQPLQQENGVVSRPAYIIVSLDGAIFLPMQDQCASCSRFLRLAYYESMKLCSHWWLILELKGHRENYFCKHTEILFLLFPLI